MGSFDSSVTCELIGIHLLRELNKIIGKNDRGLYRDDVIIPRIFSKKKHEKTVKTRKIIIKTFKNMRFEIDIKTILKVYFLDLALNLRKGTYQPYT